MEEIPRIAYILLPLNCVLWLVIISRLRRIHSKRVRRKCEEQWTHTTGTILKAEEIAVGMEFVGGYKTDELVKRQTRDKAEWYISYTYEVNGRVYEKRGTGKPLQTEPKKSGDHPATLQSAWKDYGDTVKEGLHRPAAGEPLIVYYQRENPEESTYRNPIERYQSHFTVWMTIVLLLGMFGIPAVVLALMGFR